MPLALTDDEMDAIPTAAQPIHPQQRDAFLREVAADPGRRSGSAHCARRAEAILRRAAERNALSAKDRLIA